MPRAEPLRPGETELELTWEDDGRRASPDGTWEEIWYGDSVVKITRTDLEGNTIVTEYYEGEPETTEESDALGRVPYPNEPSDRSVRHLLVCVCAVCAGHLSFLMGA